MNIKARELDKLTHFWELHRFLCNDRHDAKLEYASGGGIGTRVLLTCGCGKQMDVTDYASW